MYSVNTKDICQYKFMTFIRESHRSHRKCVYLKLKVL